MKGSVSQDILTLFLRSTNSFPQLGNGVCIWHPITLFSLQPFLLYSSAPFISSVMTSAPLSALEAFPGMDCTSF